jgi:AvrE-family Type-III effector proteins (T3Es)
MHFFRARHTTTVVPVATPPHEGGHVTQGTVPSAPPESQGPLAGLGGRPAGVPRVKVGQTRGSHEHQASVKGTDKKTAKALQQHVLGQNTGLVSTTPAVPGRPGSTTQLGRTRDGAAVHLAIGTAGVSAVPSYEPAHPVLETKRRSRLRRLMAPVLDRLPNRPAVARASLALADAALAQPPSHLITGVAASASGKLFGLGPDGGLYRFDDDAKAWSPAGGEGRRGYAQIGPQPDGQLYAVCAAEGGGAEIVRLDGDEAEVVHASDRPISSYAVGQDGSVLALDDSGRLHRSQGDAALSGPLRLLDPDGQPLDGAGQSDAATGPAAIALAGDRLAYVAGHDGHMYRLDLSRPAIRQGFVAQQMPQPFEGRPELARDSTLVDFGHTLDPESGEPALHALFRRPGGEVFSAYHVDGGFKPGWRFDNAFIAQNRAGMAPVRIRPSDARAIDRDGVQIAVKRGQLHIGHDGGHWQPIGAHQLSGLKVNPSGLGRSYALQAEPLPGGGTRRRIVRIDLEGLHPQMPAGSAPRPGTVDAPVEARLSELASGAVRDFAVLESLGSSPGDQTRRLYFVDDDNRLHTRDLNGDDGPQALAVNDVGTLRQIALDGAGQLFAVAGGDDKPARLYQLKAHDDGRHEWVAQDLPLAPGHTLAGIESSWTGRLQLTVAPPPVPDAALGADAGADAPPGPATYLYSAKTGLAPLDRQGAIDALRAAGGRDIHLPGLPHAHLKAEFLGFKSTSRPFLSNTVNWFQSAWAHTRALGSAPKVGARWVQHKRQGREGLQPVYQGTSAAAGWYRANLSAGSATPAPTELTAHLDRIAQQEPALADEMRTFTEDLMRNSRQMLQHVGHATGFLDANLSDAADFKMKRPKSVDTEHDLVGDLHRWFAQQAGASGSPEAQQALGLLRRMHEAPHRLYLRQPDADTSGRSSKDKTLLLNTRIVRNIQAVHELNELAAAGASGADLRSRFEALRSAHAGDPLTQYSSLAFKNSQQMEDTYDVVRSFGRMLNNWRHPMNRTVAESLAITSPSRRKKDLIKAADNGQIDPNLLAHYGMADAATLKAALKDKQHPEHARLGALIKAEGLEELKSRFVDTLVGMKTKESYVLDRNYGGGLDPLSYLNNKLGAFAFIGGVGGRDYNISVEVLGDDPRGGDIGFLFEKSRDGAVEVAAGWGKSAGKGHGFLHHFKRGAVIGEIGVRHTHGDGMLFMVPRDRLREFTDGLFDFGKKGEGELKDLQTLLASTYERETHVRSELGVEAKVQGFFRMGPNGYNDKAGGHFWAARPSLFHAGVGIGFEKTTYKMHGQTLDGELQAGAERHRYWNREADIRLPGLRFRSWFNFPTSEDSVHQGAIGVGNTDNEVTVGVHDKSGAKCEYRAAVPQPVQPGQWDELLDGAVQAFPEHAERLDSLKAWSGEPAAFAQRLAGLRDEIQRDWRPDGGHKKDLLSNLDLMRWQHSLALAGKPMHFGVIHELREANASRLTQPAMWTKLGESVYGQGAAIGHPLRDMQAQLEHDPTLRQLVHDLQATHPGRVKIKMELKPEAMDRLVQMQLDEPDLPESRVAAFIRDPMNFRINTIAALKSSEVANGASVWPVIGVTSGTSTSLEELTGSVHFEYDTEGQTLGYRLDGAFAQQRRSVQKPQKALAANGLSPATLPPARRLPVGEAAPAERRPVAPGGSDDVFRDANSEFAPPTLAELFAEEPLGVAAEPPGQSGRSEYFETETGPAETALRTGVDPFASAHRLVP